MNDLMQNDKTLSKSKLAIIIAFLAMLLFAFHTCTHMVGAGDTWVALACGRHFINHGVNTVEPFSANSHKAGPTPEEIQTWPHWAQVIASKVSPETLKFWHPTGWVNQNWLTHTIFYWLAYDSPIADAKNLCFNSLVYWKFAIYILAVLCIYFAARVLGTHPALAAFFACAALFVGRSFIDIRPAGFSNLLVAAFILILALAAYRNYLYIWLIVPLIIFWANVHGGYIYVFIILVPFVFLRFFILLPKRWTASIFSILTWLALYVLIIKDTAHDPFNDTAVSPSSDKFLFLILVFIIASLVLAFRKNIKTFVFYGFHVLASLVIFFTLLARLFPQDILLQNPRVADYVEQCQLSFVIAFAAAAALGIIVTSFKNRLLVATPVALRRLLGHDLAASSPDVGSQSVPTAQGAADIILKKANFIALAHITAAGFIAFIASILFNPFHLTNLTHTFQISISQNAEGWRNVHEWWPAFRWDNPVGTAMPFMIMLISGTGVFLLYLAARLLYPAAFKNGFPGGDGISSPGGTGWASAGSQNPRGGQGPYSNPRAAKGARQETDKQVKRFEILSKITALAGMMLVMWVVLLSLSFVEANPAGFLLSAIFGAILWASIFINVHFIHIIIPFSILAAYSGDAPSYSGRYIFPFITLPFYALMFLVMAQSPKKPKYSMVNIFYVFAAAAASLILMVILVNPFAFKSPIWHAPGQLLHLQRVWQPEYEANLEITYEGLFAVIYIINMLCILAWVGYDLFRAIMADAGQKTEERGQDALDTRADRAYLLPKIDLTLIIIAALTSYMAFRSRRFIPIAGYVTCPVIAMLLDQFIKITASSWNYYRRGQLSLPGIPAITRKLLITAAAITVTGLGGFWGQKFYNVYMATWPFDPDLTSMFMRMTASHMKPFAACQFIDENKLSGNMFNYWTEGGFIAWGQEPDPNTGKTPLQLFMDGRAQAAYNYDAYTTWSEIMFGGEVVKQAQMRNRNLTEQDYYQIGLWLNKELKKWNVWVILMPSGQADTPFVKGIEYSTDWRLVYLDDKQKLYVNITTPRGKELFEGIETGQTKYPYPAMRNIMLANNAILFSTNPQQIVAGLDSAIKAAEERPSRISMQLLNIYYEKVPSLRARVDQFWKRYLDDFLANEKKYEHSSNYHYRVMGAILAISHLQPIAVSQKNEELMKLYYEKGQELPLFVNRTSDMRW